jgi:hypothetical protein
MRPPPTRPGLDGDWDVRRRRGPMPPLVGVSKRIAGAEGVTRLGPVPVGRFDVVERPGGVALEYRRPLTAVVDELRPAPEGGWLGTMTVLGRPVGGFRMRRRPAET